MNHVDHRHMPTGEYVDSVVGEYVDEAIGPRGYGELVEEAVRGQNGTVWHRSRCGITQEGIMVVEWYLTYCGIYIRAGHGWHDAHAVPEQERCARCDWSNIQ